MQIFQSRSEFPGHCIDKDDLHKDSDNVKIILEMAKPTRFVLLWDSDYYVKFCPNLAHNLKPLHDLLKDGVEFSWAKKQQLALENTKKLSVGDSVRAHIIEIFQSSFTAMRQMLELILPSHMFS